MGGDRKSTGATNRWTDASGPEIIDTPARRPSARDASIAPNPRVVPALPAASGVGVLRGDAGPGLRQHRRNRARRQQKSLSTFICCPVPSRARPPPAAVNGSGATREDFTSNRRISFRPFSIGPTRACFNENTSIRIERGPEKNIFYTASLPVPSRSLARLPPSFCLSFFTPSHRLSTI